MREGKDKYKMSKEEYQARNGDVAVTIANNILLEAEGGFNGQVAAESIKRLLSGMEKSSRLLEDEAVRLLALPVEARKVDIQAMTRAISNGIKGIDDLYRLASFAKGRPDSRPDLGRGLMQGLLDSQIEQVEKWVKENQAFDHAKVINGDNRS